MINEKDILELSNADIKKIQTDLKEINPNVQNISKIKEKLQPYEEEASYSIYTNPNNESYEGGDFFITYTNGKAPNKYSTEYAKEIEIKLQDVEGQLTLYPSFSSYIQVYECIMVLLCAICSIMFYLLLRYEYRHSFIKNKVRFLLKKLLGKRLKNLSVQLLFVNIFALSIAFTGFLFMYENRYAFFDFLYENRLFQKDYANFEKEINAYTQDKIANKANRKEISAYLTDHAYPNSEIYIYKENGDFYTGTENRSIATNFLRNSIYDVSALYTPVIYQNTISFKNQYALLSLYSYPLVFLMEPYIAIVVLIALSFYLLLFPSFISGKVKKIKQLHNEVELLSSGEWSHEIQHQGTDEIAVLGEHLDQLRISFIDNTEKEKEARDANRELISAMSHDIRTPLTTLNGYLEILYLQKGDPSEYKNYIQNSLRKVEEIKELSNRMLSYALVYGQEEETTLSNISYEDWIRLLNENISFATLKKFDVQVEYTEDTNLILYANLPLMKRIYNNIFTNIYKYGNIEKPITIQCVQNKGILEIRITNMKNKEQEKVESNQIGLKSVHKMMELQHGSCYVIDEEELFSIVLSFPIKQKK